MVLALGGSGVDFGEGVANISGTKLVNKSGEEFGNQKYSLLPIIQEETWLMDRFQASDYIYPRYGNHPVYESECQRLLEEMEENGREIKRLLEEGIIDKPPLSEGHNFAFDKLCTHANVTFNDP